MIPQNIQNEISIFCKITYVSKKFIRGTTSVPVSGKVFDEEELFAGVEAVLDGWWTEGRIV